MPITEECQAGIGITNPYGRTKYMCEDILKDFKKSMDLQNKPFSVTILRYFNPVGNHPEGMIGEDPNGIPNNLMPFVAQVAVGKRAELSVFGGDYETKDGTGVRDYIHVLDLADAHIKSINYMLRDGGNSGGFVDSAAAAAVATTSGFNKYSVFNIGTGIGYSVLDMVNAMKKACKKDIPYKIVARREGDIATCYADSSKANRGKAGYNLTSFFNLILLVVSSLILLCVHFLVYLCINIVYLYVQRFPRIRMGGD